MPREEIVTGRAGFEEIEVEMVIRGPPPQWCSCKCPEYNRDPCLACGIRPVKSIDRGSIQPGGELYFIPRSEIERILNERRVEEKKNGNYHE